MDVSDIIEDGLDPHKCSNCGAPLVYHPGKLSLNCEYCGSEEAIVSENTIEENDYNKYLENYEKENYNETKIVRCRSCKAESTVDENLSSMQCPYCNSPLIEQDIHLERYIKPEYVFPFRYTKEQIPSLLKAWVNKLWFSPNSLKKAVLTALNLKGIYTPYWTFDANTKTHYTGERGTDYTVTVGTGKNRRTETRTRWTSVSGVVQSFYDDVLVYASQTLDIKILKKIENWDTKQIVKYNPSFLSGFITEKYQVDLKEGFVKAEAIMEANERVRVRRDIGGDRQDIRSMDMKLFNVKFKHILLPIYVSSYMYKNKTYIFYVNGVTGKLSGDRPYSAWKIFFAVLLASIVIGFLIYLFQE